jgi:hypothetical protein
MFLCEVEWQQSETRFIFEFVDKYLERNIKAALVMIFGHGAIL